MYDKINYMSKVSKIDKNIKYKFSKEEKKDIASLKELKPFSRFYKRYSAWFTLLVFLDILNIICSIILPIYSGNLLASFAENFNANITMKYAIIITVLSILLTIISNLANRVTIFIQSSLAIDIRLDLILRINKTASATFDKNETSKFTTRIFSDANIIPGYATEVISYIKSFATKIGFFAYTFYLNIWIGLFMLGYLAISICTRFYLINLQQKQYKVEYELEEKETNLQIENIRGMRDIRNLNTSDSLVKEICNKSISNTSISHRFALTAESYALLSEVLLYVMNFAFIALCVYLITSGQLELAGFMIAYNYRGSLQSFSSTVAYMKQNLNIYALRAKRVNELYNEQLYPLESFGDKELPNFEGKVEFKNVSFQYEDNLPVLKNVSFTIQPHTIVSFVGESGTGKSTIIGLFNKLYTVADGHGEILLDGININTLTKDSIRNNVCIVSQNPYIFNMTIAENLRLAKENATDEELSSALKQAEMLDFVDTLPDKLEARLGENGVKLSGGQKQRIAIARALLKNAKVIVFDEATSSLDNENQAKIKSVIKSLSTNHTIVMVAHRLSTVVDSDNIIFIKNGQVFAQGTHNELMKTCKEYNKLYKQEDFKSEF